MARRSSSRWPGQARHSLAAEDGRLPRLDPAALSTGFAAMLSRIAGIAGLLIAFFSLGGTHARS